MNYKNEKNVELTNLIINIFNQSYGKYGRKRIKIALEHYYGLCINEKKIARIMKENEMSGCSKARSYHSYKGQIGKIAPNLLNRNFKTTGPYQKLGTDITQFICPFGKLYLSPIIDFHTREVLAYDISEHPNYAQIRRMLNSLYEKHGNKIKGCILHSDQGYQYQVKEYQKWLKDHGITQSMSRKGNCLDNSPTENFFGRLKTEMYYDKEYSFKSLDELKQEIIKYINFYNNNRIVLKNKVSPIESRQLYNKNNIIYAS